VKHFGVDTNKQVQEIQHDLHAIDQTAERSADRFVRLVAPFLALAAVLMVFAWCAGRRSGKRSKRRG